MGLAEDLREESSNATFPCLQSSAGQQGWSHAPFVCNASPAGASQQHRYCCLVLRVTVAAGYHVTSLEPG